MGGLLSASSSMPSPAGIAALLTLTNAACNTEDVFGTTASIADKKLAQPHEEKRSA